MNPLGAGRIGQIHVSVRDVDASVAFYRDVLGLKLLFRVPDQPMAFFDCAGVRLYLGRPESHAFESHPVVYFSVDDVEASHAELAARGVAFVGPPHVVHRTAESELWMAFFRDPDGTHLALMAERPLPA